MFAHGFGTDQTSWHSVTHSLQACHKTVLFDHVGFGASDRLAFDATRHGSLLGYAQDVLDIIERLDLCEVTFVGHSIGAILGLLASIARPQRFKSLVLLNASPHFIDEPPDYEGGFQRAELSGMLELMDRDYAAWADFLAPAAIGPANDPGLVSAFGQGLHSLDPLITRRFARLVFFLDCRAEMARVDVPALVLQSTDDEFVPRSVGHYLHRALAGSAFRELQASGHCPHITQPGLVIEALRDHLSAA